MGTMWVLWGLTAGIAVNYLADVLPATRRFSKPHWWPITVKNLGAYFSSLRVITVLLFYLFAAYLLTTNPPNGFPAPTLFLVAIYFGLVTVIDIEYRAVLHSVSLVGVLFMSVIGGLRHGLLFTVIGGGAGFLIMLILHYAGNLIAGFLSRSPSQSDEPALGFGDVNLGGVIGLLMGWPGVVVALIFGIFIAGLFSLFYIGALALTRRYQRFAAIPYAPFLCLGATGIILLSVY